MTERLQKFLAKSGIGSRRYCENLIKQGLVKVNGKIAKEWMSIAQCFAGPPEQPPVPGARFTAVK